MTPTTDQKRSGPIQVLGELLNVEFAVLSQDLNSDDALIPPDPQVDCGVQYPEIFYLYFIQMVRQGWVGECNPSFARLDRKSKASLQKQVNRTSRPGLRRASHRIQRGSAGVGPLVKSAEKLGQSAQLYVPAGRMQS